jgi:hypothetical protein
MKGSVAENNFAGNALVILAPFTKLTNRSEIFATMELRKHE